MISKLHQNKHAFIPFTMNHFNTLICFCKKIHVEKHLMVESSSKQSLCSGCWLLQDLGCRVGGSLQSDWSTGGGSCGIWGLRTEQCYRGDPHARRQTSGCGNLQRCLTQKGTIHRCTQKLQPRPPHRAESQESFPDFLEEIFSRMVLVSREVVSCMFLIIPMLS